MYIFYIFELKMQIYFLRARLNHNDCNGVMSMLVNINLCYQQAKNYT